MEKSEKWEMNEPFLPPQRLNQHRVLLLVTKLLCLLSIIALGYLIYDHLAFEIRILQEEKSAIQAQSLVDKTYSELYREKADHLLHETPHLSAPPQRIVCYYTIVHDNSSLQPEQIDPNLCTHVIVLNAQVVNYTLHPSSPGDIDIYRRVMQLKMRNPKLKIMLCLGTGNSVTGLPAVVKSEVDLSRFVSQSTSFLIMHHFDGLDIDWEFPSREQHANYTRLLKEEYTAFAPHGLILTAAVGAPKTIIDESYDIPAMAPYVDWVNLMCYDYHFYVRYYPLTGANSPLFPRTTQIGYFHTLNVAWSASQWVEKGMPLEKVVVGVPTYGHSFHLLTEYLHGFSAPATGVGSIGAGGFTSVVDSCKFLEGGAKKVFNAESKVPYAYKGHDWVSYEDEESATYKGQWIRENGFGGIMIFSFNSDDYKAECPGVKSPNPIMNALVSAYKGT